MAMQKLSLESLMESLDGGRVNAAFEAELKRCINDCDDRPADDKARKITLEMSIIPVMDDAGHLDEIKGKFHVKSTVPSRRSKAYSFGFRKTTTGPQLTFNDMSEGDIHQRTIDE